jgi:Ca2+-transporting ATPase
MTVTKIWSFGESKPIQVTRKQGSTSLDAATRTILRIGNIVNHGRLSAGDSSSTSQLSILSSTMGDDPAQAKSRWVGQPTDVALLDLLDSFEENDVRNRIGPRLFETPFSSERKWMGVVIKRSESSDSEMAYVKGAIEQILSKCDTYLTSDGREIVLDGDRRKEAISAAESMATEGLRVLAFASGSVQAKGPQISSGRSTPSSRPGTKPPSKDEEV